MAAFVDGKALAGVDWTRVKLARMKQEPKTGEKSPDFGERNCVLRLRPPTENDWEDDHLQKTRNKTLPYEQS